MFIDTAPIDGEVTWHSLVDFVNQKQVEARIPGIAVGIFHKGEISAQGFGVTNVDHPQAVTDTTLFQIGSITKTFTGTLVMHLVEQGKIDLDTTIRTYLPNFRVVDDEASERSTVRDLMAHLGGWEGDLFLDTGNGDDALDKYVVAMAEQTQLSPLGKNWSYNNAGFAVLGLIIERVTGKSYEQALKKIVLEPLGMTHAYLDPTAVMTHRFVVGHSVGPSETKVMTPWHLQRSAGSMGGLITDVHNLLRYAQFHMGDESLASQPVLSRERVRAMQTPQADIWGEERWGLTWGLETIDGVVSVHHTGGTTGQITRLQILPERNFAIVVFTNAQQGGPVGKAIADYALELYLGLKRPDWEVQKSSPEALASYAGFYRNAMSEMELGILGGRLVGQLLIKGGFPTKETPPPPPPPPFTMGVVAENRLMVLDGGMKNQTVDVVRNTDGSIGWLRSGGRLFRRDS